MASVPVKFTTEVNSIAAESAKNTEVEAFGDIEGVDFPIDTGASEPGIFWYATSFDPATVTQSMARRCHRDGVEAAREKLRDPHGATRDLFFAGSVVDCRALSKPADVAVQVEFIPFTRRHFLKTETLVFLCPDLPDTCTQQTGYAVAEKAADLIKALRA
ncbi:glucose oxidase [Colletotrichum orchidophilum]|uniref:Glucose oxidase n=1 Tax=Colletotrichum orchidophilum TaxID=1209926 RepID=A0A1G4B9F1_9PEZI|nr:glucose oxidase [Colletotrichum orchidophilum]OHE98044.1 glucose oxidase [Colletotrichum orchidophilum]